MRYLPTTSLSLLLILATILTFTDATAPSKVQCTPASRNQDCTNQPSQYTCGYYTKNCPLNVCGKPMSDPCSACQDPDVDYYIVDLCPSDSMVFTCADSGCDGILDPYKYTRYNPACGYKADCKQGRCSKTVNNICAACQQNNSDYFQVGMCQEDKFYCNATKRLTNCANQPQSVSCAFFNIPDDTQDGQDVYATVNTKCDACRDTSVTYFSQGSCPVSVDNKTFCLPHARPTTCDNKYQPVCGFYTPAGGYGGKHKKITNACTACQDPGIVYHIPGPCVFYCDRNPYTVTECDGSTVNVVCGSYRKNGRTYKITLKNPCVACYDSDIEIDSYVEGICPGDEGILCSNDADGYLNGLLSPVCGVTKKGCNNKNCRKTYAEPRLACSDSSVILYAPGVCPGDQGITCTGYRAALNNGDDPSLTWDGEVYTNVCGYLKTGCKTSSCRASFRNQFAACKNTSVLYFTNEQC